MLNQILRKKIYLFGNSIQCSFTVLISILLIIWAKHSYDHYDMDLGNDDFYDGGIDDMPRKKRKKKFDNTPSDYSQTNVPKKIKSAFKRYLSGGKVSRSLDLPSTEDELLSWNMPNRHDKKEKLIEDTTDHMCQLINRDYRDFCPTYITLVERLAAGEYHNAKLYELNKLSEDIDEILGVKHKKLKNLKSKFKKMKGYMPKQHREILKSTVDIQDQIHKIDEKIMALKNKKEITPYDQEKIQSLEEEKEILREESQELKKDFNQKKEAADKMALQQHQLQDQIDHLEQLSKKIEKEINSREESQDLALAWDEMGDLWAKHEESERKQKEYQAKSEQQALKEKAEREQQAQAQEKKEKESLMTMAERLKTATNEQDAGKIEGFGLDSLFKIVPDVLDK